MNSYRFTDSPPARRVSPKFRRMPLHIHLQKWVEENTGLVTRVMAARGETDPYRAAKFYLTEWEPNLEKALFLWWLGERPQPGFFDEYILGEFIPGEE